MRKGFKGRTIKLREPRADHLPYHDFAGPEEVRTRPYPYVPPTYPNPTTRVSLVPILSPSPNLRYLYP